MTNEFKLYHQYVKELLSPIQTVIDNIHEQMTNDLLIANEMIHISL